MATQVLCFFGTLLLKVTPLRSWRLERSGRLGVRSWKTEDQKKQKNHKGTKEIDYIGSETKKEKREKLKPM